MLMFNILTIFFGSFAVSLSMRDYDFEMDRVEAIKGDVETLVDYSGIRLHRRGFRYIANGSLSFNADMGKEVMHMMKTTYSASGTNQFRTHPYTVVKTTICDYFKNFYRKYGQPWIAKHTNFTHIPKEGICPLKKGFFYLKDLDIDEVNLPSHAPRGYWKVEQIFEKKGKHVGGIAMYARIINKYA